MTATNHALTGALIGLSVHNPWLALPAAVLSHFICDSLPHYGDNPDAIRTDGFRRLLVVEASLCLAIVAVLSLLRPEHWVLAAICAFLATSPDLMWINKFRLARQGQSETAKPAAILRFHAWIQWFERPSGAAVEVAWLVAAVILLKLYVV